MGDCRLKFYLRTRLEGKRLVIALYLENAGSPTSYVLLSMVVGSRRTYLRMKIIFARACRASHGPSIAFVLAWHSA